MFDIAPSEFLLVALVALVVIGPKDLPKAMRVIGYWVGRARGVTRQFREGFDTMMREAELKELEEKWAAENARIMADHSANAPVMLPHGGTGADPVTAETISDAQMIGDDDYRQAAIQAEPWPDGEAPIAMVPRPHIVPSTPYPAPPSDDEIAAAEGVPPDVAPGSAAA